MTDLNKLAEALDEITTARTDLYMEEKQPIREAAAILRAAAGADVQTFMRMVDEHGLANYRDGLDDKSGKGADATDVTIKRSEIEYAIRLALPVWRSKAKDLQVGGYTLRRFDETSVWIETESGEGGQFNEKNLVDVLSKFYADNF